MNLFTGEIGQFTKGQHFGVLDVTDENYSYTITAKRNVECLVLSHEYLSYFRRATVTEITPIISIEDEFKNMKLNDLKIIRTLGVGAYGTVGLARHKTTKKEYAIKYVKKKFIIDNNLEDLLINEKRLQMECNSKFLVRMYRSFRDTEYVYFLLEACCGFDLFNLLHCQKNRSLKDKHAKFVAGTKVQNLAELNNLLRLP